MIGFRGRNDEEEKGYHRPRDEGFSNNRGWQGETQQSTVVDGGGQKEGQQGNHNDDHNFYDGESLGNDNAQERSAPMRRTWSFVHQWDLSSHPLVLLLLACLSSCHYHSCVKKMQPSCVRLYVAKKETERGMRILIFSSINGLEKWPECHGGGESLHHPRF